MTNTRNHRYNTDVSNIYPRPYWIDQIPGLLPFQEYLSVLIQFAIDTTLCMGEYIGSFVSEFIDWAKLIAKEKLGFNFNPNILDLIGGKPRQVQHLKSQ